MPFVRRNSYNFAAIAQEAAAFDDGSMIDSSGFSSEYGRGPQRSEVAALANPGEFLHVLLSGSNFSQ